MLFDLDGYLDELNLVLRLPFDLLLDRPSFLLQLLFVLLLLNQAVLPDGPFQG